MSLTVDPSCSAFSMLRVDEAAVVGLDRTDRDDALPPACSAGVVTTFADVDVQLDRLLEGGAVWLTIDMSGVDVTSTTVAVLLCVKRRCAARGVVLTLRDPSSSRLGVLKCIGLVGPSQAEHRASSFEPPPDQALG
jgi:hypothetical protein